MNNSIKYANCWEDADLLLSASRFQKNMNIISIASGGDNSFALLSTSPKILCAVDTNEAQLHLCELKAAAFSELDYNEMLEFITGTTRAKEIYETIKKQLSPSCRYFWDLNGNSIQKGLINSGKFEIYFHFFRKWIMPLIHSNSKIDQLLCNKTEDEQFNYYNATWKTLKWKYLFKLFFSKFVLGRFGRTTSYLNQVEIPVAEYIYSKAETHLQSKDCQTNYFLYYIFTGTFKPELPYYLRKENFEIIKNNLSSLSLKKGLIQNFISKENNFNFCNFSNIFEYMNMEEFTIFHDMIIQNLPNHAVINYWNLMVDRQFSQSFPNTFSSYDKKTTENDKGFFYKRFVTEIKI